MPGHQQGMDALYVEIFHWESCGRLAEHIPTNLGDLGAWHSVGSSPSSPSEEEQTIINIRPWPVQADARLGADHLFALESTGSTASRHS